MPTHDETDRFSRDFDKLTRADKVRFLEALEKFIEDLVRIEDDASASIRSGLRVKPYQSGGAGDMELSYAPDGRALFRYGESLIEGKQHVVWLRVGDHGIL